MVHTLITLGYGNEEYVKKHCTVETFWRALALENRKYIKE